ncbi:MAG: MBL fold metallo-hydrolase [Dehalococcoidia bacterium]
MDIRILGAHSSELRGARLASLLVDDTLLIDAGGVTSALSLHEQERIRTVLLTHHHFDHTRDLVTLAANAANYWQGQLVVCGPGHTLDIVARYLFDGVLYVNFLEYPSKARPCVVLDAIEPNVSRRIAGYDVLALPAKHSVPAVGYQVTSHDGKSFFYTGDTCGGLADFRQVVSTRLLITEVTGPNENADWLRTVGHLCPAAIKEELEEWRRVSGRLPRVIVVHIGNAFERQIEREVARVAKELEADIIIGHEDMQVAL